MHYRSLEVDLEALCSITHTCRMCSGNSQCCSRYEIIVTENEVRNIDNHLPAIAAYCPDILTSDGYDNLFDPVESNLYAIDPDDEGYCPFSYRKGRNRLCALHSIAQKNSMALRSIKPLSCLLWPLALEKKGRCLHLSIQENAFDFKCNRQRPAADAGLCSSLADHLGWVFGSAIKEGIENAVSDKQKKVSLTMKRSICF